MQYNQVHVRQPSRRERSCTTSSNTTSSYSIFGHLSGGGTDTALKDVQGTKRFEPAPSDLAHGCPMDYTMSAEDSPIEATNAGLRSAQGSAGCAEPAQAPICRDALDARSAPASLACQEDLGAFSVSRLAKSLGETNTHGAVHDADRVVAKLYSEERVDLHASNMWVSAQPPAALLYVGIPFTPLHPAESIFRVAEVYQIPPDVAVIGSQFHGAVRFRLEMSANGPGRAPAPCAAFLDFLRDSNKQHTASVLLEAMCLNLASKVVGTPVYSPAAFLNHLQGAINPHGNRDTPWTAGQAMMMELLLLDIIDWRVAPVPQLGSPG